MNIGANIMTVDLKVKDYRNWLQKNVTLIDPFSTASLKKLVTHLLLGKNYRILTEQNTKDKLIVTYVWLKDIVKESRKNYGEKWRENLMEQLVSSRNMSKEEKDLAWWLIGIAKKTADNLDIKKEDLMQPEEIAELVLYLVTHKGNAVIDELHIRRAASSPWF